MNPRQCSGQLSEQQLEAALLACHTHLGEATDKEEFHSIGSEHQVGHCPCANYHIPLDPGCILFPWHKASPFPSDSKTPDDVLPCTPSKTEHTSLLRFTISMAGGNLKCFTKKRKLQETFHIQGTTISKGCHMTVNGWFNITWAIVFR